MCSTADETNATAASIKWVNGKTVHYGAICLFLSIRKFSISGHV